MCVRHPPTTSGPPKQCITPSVTAGYSTSCTAKASVCPRSNVPRARACHMNMTVRQQAVTASEIAEDNYADLCRESTASGGHTSTARETPHRLPCSFRGRYTVKLCHSIWKMQAEVQHPHLQRHPLPHKRSIPYLQVTAVLAAHSPSCNRTALASTRHYTAANNTKAASSQTPIHMKLYVMQPVHAFPCPSCAVTLPFYMLKHNAPANTP